MPCPLSVSSAAPTVDVTRLDGSSFASFTPSEPACVCLRAHILSSPTQRSARIHIPRITTLFRRHTQLPDDDDTDPIPSPTTSLPSITRTHTSATSSSLPPTPPSHSPPLPQSASDFHHSLTAKIRRHYPASPRHRRALSTPVPPTHPPHPRYPLPPTTSPATAPPPPSPQQPLAAVEAASKLMRTRSACAQCGTLGADFPRCPWCGDAWCSRPCRIAARGKTPGAHGHGCIARRNLPPQ